MAHACVIRAVAAGTLALIHPVAPALAADLWNRPPARWDGTQRPMPRPPIWDGLAVGGNIGAAFPGGSGNFAGDALIGGLHAGYNFSSGNLVTGVEFDASWSGMDGRRTLGATTISTDIDFLATARARVGWAQSFWHIYLTGGLAFGDVTTHFQSGGASASDSAWRTGWVAGGGIEAKADTRVSLRLEALYHNLGSETVRTSAGSSRVDADVTTVRAGVTFHFN